MEKNRPTYDLQAFQDACVSKEGIEVTGSARLGAHQLGFDYDGIVEVLRSMERSDFYKSMTSLDDHKVWQDVYRVPWGDLEIYIKFTAGRVLVFRLLSFKER